MDIERLVEASQDTLIDSFSTRVSVELAKREAAIVESHLNVYVKHRPPHVPIVTWKKMLSDVLRIEKHLVYPEVKI